MAEERVVNIPESKPKLKPSVEASEQPTCDWGNVNSPETYRLLTEARGYFLLPGVIKRGTLND